MITRPLNPPDVTATVRADELAALMTILAAQRPAIVNVDGPPGIGKSSLLAAAAASARRQGWSVVGSDELPLQIDRAGSEEDFIDDVLELLTEPDDDANDDFELPVFMRERSDSTGDTDPITFAERLRRAAPLLVVIDAYRPGPTFRSWFETLAGALMRSPSPVIVIAANRDGADEMGAFVSHTVHLKPLKPERVRQCLEAIGPTLKPPLGDDELDEYSRSVTTGLQLESLLRLLWLVRDTGSSS